MRYRLKAGHTFLYFILYLIVYRFTLFQGQFLPSSYFYIMQYFFTGLFMDISFLFLVFYLFRFRSTSVLSYLLLFSLIILVLINILLTQVYLSGLVSFSHLVDYASDSLPLIQTGNSFVSFYSIFSFLILPCLLLIFSEKKNFLNELKLPDILRRKVIRKHLPLFGFFLFLSLGSFTTTLATNINISSKNILLSNVVYRMLGYELEAYLKKNEYDLLNRGIKNKKLRYPDKAHFEAKGYQFKDQDFPLAKYPLREKKIPKVKPNIIMIILESFAAKDTGFQKYNRLPGKDVTPFLNSLIPKSVVVTHFFSNADYTAGAETAALCSTHDTLHYMVGNGSILRNHTYTNLRCLPEIFLELGYSTSFFHSYTTVFDNKYIFFPLNGVQEVIDRDHKAFDGLKRTIWGIADHEMFNYGVEYLDRGKKPFFSVFLTVNNHIPFILHDKRKKIDFKENPKYNAYLNTMRQTDEALKLLMDKASEKDWYEDTIFVITSDNGVTISGEDLKKMSWENFFKMWHLVPFLIYNPKQKFGLKPVVLNLKAASHIDIPPTILDIIGINISNPFAGESIFSPKRRGYTLVYDWFKNYYRLSWPYLYHNTDHQVYDLEREMKVTSKKIGEYRKWVEGNRDLLNYLIYKNKIWPEKQEAQ